MYRIETTTYGFRLTFGGIIRRKEMAEWLEASRETLTQVQGEFSVFVDMRTLAPLPEESQSLMQKGQAFYRGRGMQRSVVILDNPATKAQFKRIALQSGIYDWERYLDAATTPKWEEIGLDWIINAVDPDLTPHTETGRFRLATKSNPHTSPQLPRSNL